MTSVDKFLDDMLADEHFDLEDLVSAAVTAPAYQAAVGEIAHEKRWAIAEAAITAALVHIGLVVMVEEAQHKVAGHG